MVLFQKDGNDMTEQIIILKESRSKYKAQRLEYLRVEKLVHPPNIGFREALHQEGFPRQSSLVKFWPAI